MIRYPATPTVDHVDDYHGDAVADPYRWLEDIDAPETREWVEHQNAVTQQWLAEAADRDDLRRRLSALIDHPRAGVPWHRSGRWFQLRNTGLQNQDVLYTMAAPDDLGHVLLDPNTLSEDGTVALSGLSVSPDGRLLAYALSEAGSDWMTWRVLETETGNELPDSIPWGKFSGAAWAPDASGFWYSRYDAPAPGATHEQINRDHKLCFHRLGDDAVDDVVVYERPDQPEWGFSPHVTDDGSYLIVDIWHGTDPRNRVAVRDLQAGTDLQMLFGDADAAYAVAGNIGSVLYVRTDLDAPRGRVLAVGLDDRRPEAWPLIAETDDTLEAVWLIGGRLLCRYLHHGANRLRWFSVSGDPLGEVPLEPLSSIDAVSGRSDDPACCYAVTSFVSPSRVYRYDIDSASVTLLHDPGVGVEDAVAEQTFVETDGARVPYSVVHRSDVTPDGQRAVWLYAYGGFNIPVTPRWKPEWNLWVSLGGVVVVANVRGGGEYGQDWHDAGRLRNKARTFDDLIAVAEDLIATGWTRSGRIAVNGGSNGGLTAASVGLRRPDLFGAVVPEVGVLDLLRFHRFTIGWAWTSDYGNPDDPEDYAWIRPLSPLHSIVAGQAYPPTLLVTSDHDDRVVPAHTYKFAAALQAAQGGDAPVLLRVETDAGHGAGKPVSKIVAERADVVAFLARSLRLLEPERLR